MIRVKMSTERRPPSVSSVMLISASSVRRVTECLPRITRLSPDEQQNGTETKPDLNCNLHKSIPINWYCKSCSIPVCSECLIENHKDHDSDKLENIEAALKLDMLDVSEMAVKRLQRLQELSAELKENETKMEDELDEVSKDISKTADGLCELIRQHEATLQGKVKEAREEARKQFKKAGEELQRANENTSSLRSQAESLYQAPSEQALSTVVHAQLTKQQNLHQGSIPMSSPRWSLKKQVSNPGKLSESTCLGSVDLTSKLEETCPLDNFLGKPLQVTHLEYKSNKLSCSITPLYESLICVAHFREKPIWVYSDSGKLQQKVEIQDIKSITGMVAVDEKTGKLALVDGTETKVHFVTLATNLAVQRHSTEKIPIEPYRISLFNRDQLVVSSKSDTRVIIISIDGEFISDVRLSLPLKSLDLYAVQRTKSGFVACDGGNEKIYFTDKEGLVLHTYTNCVFPTHALQTSAGHILVSDYNAGKIGVFSEAGNLLGSHEDIELPFCTTINDSRKLMYVGCGSTGRMEMKAYKLARSDLLFLPVTCNRIELVVTLAER